MLETACYHDVLKSISRIFSELLHVRLGRQKQTFTWNWTSYRQDALPVTKATSPSTKGCKVM